MHANLADLIAMWWAKKGTPSRGDVAINWDYVGTVGTLADKSLSLRTTTVLSRLQSNNRYWLLSVHLNAPIKTALLPKCSQLSGVTKTGGQKSTCASWQIFLTNCCPIPCCCQSGWTAIREIRNEDKRQACGKCAWKHSNWGTKLPRGRRKPRSISPISCSDCRLPSCTSQAAPRRCSSFVLNKNVDLAHQINGVNPVVTYGNGHASVNHKAEQFLLLI